MLPQSKYLAPELIIKLYCLEFDLVEVAWVLLCAYPGPGTVMGVHQGSALR